MGSSITSCLFLFSLLVSSAAGLCDRCIHQSQAKFFGDNPGTITGGSCGYKDQALPLSWGGYVADGSPALYREGVGCGACYKIRCLNTDLCDSTSVKVVLTSSGGDAQTAFVLSTKAFSALAKPGKEAALRLLGNVNIEYKRDLCQYGRSMSVKVDESSTNPNYLAIEFLYQGDQTDIIGVEIAQVGTNKWVPLRRNHGAVWDNQVQVPQGALDIRVLVPSGNGNRRVVAQNALPANWSGGGIYNTNVIITDIAKEDCSPCDTTVWPSKN